MDIGVRSEDVERERKDRVRKETRTDKKGGVCKRKGF